MAERRMFAKTIIDSDTFLDLPPWAQLLYFHMGMRADDDGFVNKPRSILRLTGCRERDLQALIDKGFLLQFESGVVVIRHWRVHNWIRNDRYKPTVYVQEKASLFIDKSGAYTMCQPGGIPGDNQVVDNRDTQDRLGKDRLGQFSSDQDRFTGALRELDAPVWCVPPSLTEVMIYCKMRKNDVDVDRFVEFYRNPRNHRENARLVDWQDAVKLWEGRT